MPELPEVETVKRGLQPSVEGRRLTSVETRRGDLRAPFPEDFESRLTGRRVERLWRRAKYIMADLDGGETRVIHLGMSGRIRVYKPAGEDIGRGKHDHVVTQTEGSQDKRRESRRPRPSRQRSSQASPQCRRFVAPRSSADKRRIGVFSERVCRLRSRRSTVHETGL